LSSVLVDYLHILALRARSSASADPTEALALTAKSPSNVWNIDDESLRDIGLSIRSLMAFVQPDCGDLRADAKLLEAFSTICSVLSSSSAMNPILLAIGDSLCNVLVELLKITANRKMETLTMSFLSLLARLVRQSANGVKAASSAAPVALLTGLLEMPQVRH
jgi:hypothetical protein